MGAVLSLGERPHSPCALQFKFAFYTDRLPSRQAEGSYYRRWQTMPSPKHLWGITQNTLILLHQIHINIVKLERAEHMVSFRRRLALFASVREMASDNLVLKWTNSHHALWQNVDV